MHSQAYRSMLLSLTCVHAGDGGSGERGLRVLVPGSSPTGCLLQHSIKAFKLRWAEVDLFTLSTGSCMGLGEFLRVGPVYKVLFRFPYGM